jgi:hypothetical protein
MHREHLIFIHLQEGPRNDLAIMENWAQAKPKSGV